MAAPVVAGSAALVRQWFAQGFYPTFSATPANAYNASGEADEGPSCYLGLLCLLLCITRGWMACVTSHRGDIYPHKMVNIPSYLHSQGSW